MLTDGGMEVVVPPVSTVEAFTKLVKPLYEEWVADMDMPAATELMRGLGAVD